MNYFNGKNLTLPKSDLESSEHCVSHRSMANSFRESQCTAQDLAISQIKREVEELAKEERDFDLVRDQIRELEQRIKDITEDIHDDKLKQRDEREKALAELAHKRTQLQTLKKRFESVDALQQKYALEQADADVSVKNRQLRFAQTNDVLKDATLNYQNVKSNFENLKKEAREVLQDNSHLRVSVVTLEKHLDDALSQFKLLKEKVGKQEVQLSNYDNIHERIENENEALENEEHAIRKQIDQVENQILSLESEVSHLANEIEKSKNETFALKSNILSLEGKILKKRERISENEDGLRDLDEFINTERELNGKKLDFIASLKEEEVEKNDLISSKREEADKYKMKLEQLRKFTLRAFEEMKSYVKLDKSIGDSFARGYTPAFRMSHGENQDFQHSVFQTS
jgi:chromosome segregation ATPase